MGTPHLRNPRSSQMSRCINVPCSIGGFFNGLLTPSLVERPVDPEPTLAGPIPPLNGPAATIAQTACRSGPAGRRIGIQTETLPTGDTSMGTEAPTTVVLPVVCAPKKAPCPRCGTRGRRKRTLTRTVRTVAYKAIASLEIPCGEYAARCRCCTTFRNSPEGVPPKAKYDNKVRGLVLDRLLRDGMSIERALASIRREFLLDLSPGFVYDVLRDRAAQLDMAEHRRTVLGRFSGTLCVDELHLGRFTLLLATDPIRDLPVAFALSETNDHDHMRRFLKNLKTWGLMPRVV